MPQARILVVDDEQSILDLLTACLRQEGYEVYTATDVPAGLNGAQEYEPDLDGHERSVFILTLPLA